MRKPPKLSIHFMCAIHFTIPGDRVSNLPVTPLDRRAEHLAKKAGISLRRSPAAAKVRTAVAERLSKNPGKMLKALTKSKVLTQIL